MKTKIFTVSLFLILVCSLANLTAAQKPGAKKPVMGAGSFVKTEKEELDAAILLPPAERIEKLKAFLESHPRSNLKLRAMELIVSAHAALGEEKLTAGDSKGGIEQFRLAVASIPSEMSVKLYVDVVSQIPSNLFLRGERAAAFEVARSIEERVKSDPIRLLTIAAFYLGTESAEDAMRTAELAIKLAPTMSAAYQARASARRMTLRLDDAAADYARALELDPKSEGARRSLAELRRATGKTEEALTLYQELLKNNPADEFARTGMIVSLFELGRKEEAEREFEAALKEMPNSLALLTGAAYWFAAHNDSARAIEFAERAVQLEPRYTWGHIALARGLLQQKRIVEAEPPLLVARQYGRFPTLDYELASVLSAAGFYGEAATTLSSTFVVKQGVIETDLAGRTLAQANSFIELVAPERRASIFQFTAADNEANARSLKALLEFSTLLNSPGSPKESDVLAAARDFIAGDDDMRAYRRLYAANRLLEKDVALAGVIEMMSAITSEVEPALGAPTASVAVMADEIRDERARANANGRTVSVPKIARSVLSNIIRGRIEDLAGWALFHQGNYAEAVVRLRRATSVLPEKSVWWRNSLWHLGASLDATDKGTEALEAYYSSYKSGGPDPTRRAVIERLYRKVNGSLDGLDDKIGPPLVLAVVTPQSESGVNNNSDAKPTTPVIADRSSDRVELNTTPAESAPKSDTPADQKVATTETKPVEAAPKSDAPIEQKAETTEAKPAEVAKTDNPTSEPKADPIKTEDTKTPSVAVSSTPDATPTPTPSPAPVEVPPAPPQPAANDEPPAGTATIPTPTETTATPAGTESTSQRPRRVSEGKCVISVSESALTIQNNGGRAIVDITFGGMESTDSVTASTSDWSALAVFPEPKSATSSNSTSFSISSISKKTGVFTITFKSQCGSKDVTVTVR